MLWVRLLTPQFPNIKLHFPSNIQWAVAHLFLCPTSLLLLHKLSAEWTPSSLGEISPPSLEEAVIDKNTSQCCCC
jgi:hypothetical protein